MSLGGASRHLLNALPKKQTGSIKKILPQFANLTKRIETRAKYLSVWQTDATPRFLEITKFDPPFPERKPAFQAINHLLQVFRKGISNRW